MVWVHCPFPVNTTLFTDQSSILACAAYGLRGHGKHSRVDFPQSTVPFLRAESNLCWQTLPLPCSSGSELSLFPSSLKNSSTCEPMLSQAQLDGVKLMSKFTFIDVVEQSPSLRRSASMPARSTHPRSLAQCEDGYLAGLLEEARSALPIPHRALMATAEIAFTLPGSEDLEACDQEDVAGSLGHPYFCRRPCVLLALGRCRNGMACKYCHHAHGSEKPQAFPRNIRERINRMKGSAKLRLLRDSLHQKVQQVPELASQVTGLVDIIEEGLRNEAPESSESTGSRLREKVAVITVAAMLGDLVVEFANVVACFLFGIRSIQAESLLCWHERSPMSPETANAELKVTCSPGTSSRTFSVAYRKSSDVSASKPERSRSRGMELRAYNSDTGFTCAMVVCVSCLHARCSKRARHAC